MLQNPKIKYALLFTLLFVAIVFVVAAYYISQTPKQSANKIPSPTSPAESVVPSVPASLSPTVITSPTATPTPKPIPHGKWGFIVSVGSSVKGPRMGKGELTPWDPPVGGQQQFTIETADTAPVTRVEAILKTDNKTSPPVNLTLQSGDAQKGIWGGSWTVSDTYLYTYILTIRASSANGISSVDVTLR